MFPIHWISSRTSRAGWFIAPINIGVRLPTSPLAAWRRQTSSANRAAGRDHEPVAQGVPEVRVYRVFPRELEAVSELQRGITSHTLAGGRARERRRDPGAKSNGPNRHPGRPRIAG